MTVNQNLQNKRQPSVFSKRPFYRSFFLSFGAHVLQQLPLLLIASALLVSSCISPRGVISSLLSQRPDLTLKKRIIFRSVEGPEGCLVPSTSDGKILLIPIQGILSSGGYLTDKMTSPAYIARVARRTGGGSGYKAILLYIRSPGGTVTASDTIYRMIRLLGSKTSLPVYAHIDGLGASGAYYVAMAAKKVNASPTARVGSIGVISRSFSLQGLLQKYGIRYQAVASGKSKDMGSLFKDMSKEDEEFLRNQIQKSYENFISIILKSRNAIKKERLLELANGRVYDAAFAKTAGLIDSTLYFDEFVKEIGLDVGLAAPNVEAFLPSYMPATSVEELDLALPMQKDFTMALLQKLATHQLYYMWDHFL